MKVKHFETFYTKPRHLLVRIETDTGIHGWGEPTLEGHCEAAAAAVADLMEMVVGQDPRRIEHLWQRMYRGSYYRGGPVLCSAISGIEQALWDILGKSLNVPVWQMLGGRVRDRIRIYAQVRGRHTEAIVERLRRTKELGFKAFKFGPLRPTNIVDKPHRIEYIVDMMQKLRAEAGDEAEFMFDAHGRLSPAMSIQLAKALEPIRLMFLEEPCLPENIDMLARIARSTSVPIATGERVFTKWGFREVLEKQAAAVIQPDLSHVGGIFEARKVAAMAEAYYVGVAPHCPLSAVSLAACLQLSACTPNFVIQEQKSLGEDLLVEPFVVKDGYVDVPSRPGLGIEVDEQKLAALKHDGSWRNPELEHPDGSVADW
jgi:galactonate dehydratase